MKNLVELIQEKIGKDVSSDLPSKVTATQLKEWFSEIDINNYSIDQWNQVIIYFLKYQEKQPCFHALEEVEQWIMDDDTIEVMI